MKKHRWILWAFMLSLSLLWSNLRAADKTIGLPAKFVRITSLSEIQSSGFYLIAVQTSQNSTPAFCLLSSSSYAPSGSNSKLVALQIGTTPTTAITCETPTVVWSFERVGDSLAIYNESGWLKADGRNKSNGKINDTNIRVAAERFQWFIQETSNGLFLLSTTLQPDYYLSATNWVDFPIFGNYKNGDKELYIYKVAPQDFTEMGGNCFMPSEGQKLALYANEKTALFSQAKEVFPFLLSDTTLAPSEQFTTLTSRLQGDSTFTLQLTEDAYLSYDLTTTSSPLSWKIKKGMITTTEEVERQLVFNESEFCVLTYDSTSSTKIKPASFLAVGALPDSTVSNGVKTLSGAWSAAQLAAISWENIQELDLTSLRLPVLPLPFRQKENTVIYVSETEKQYIPSSWASVVVCNSTENVLTTPFSLKDKSAVQISRPVVIKKGQVTYTRQFLNDGGWTTLCLPFDTDVPADFIAEEPEKITTDSILLQQVYTIRANEPVLLKYNGKEKETIVTANFASREGTLQTKQSSSLQNNYTLLRIGENFPETYFLNTSGTAFAKASQGSTLFPFRAFLQKTAQANQLTIRHSLIQ